MELDMEEECIACNSSNDFDCNICLELVQDPVVTLCGHLYCWPCIYKWMQFNSISKEQSDQRPQCPVCKAGFSVAALVPLYGRGEDTTPSQPNCGPPIPERPSGPICPQIIGQLQEPDHPHYSTRVPRLGGTNAFRPIIEIFEGIFGHSVTNSYITSGVYYTPRMRRQLMHADQSLSRFCFFIFCCMILCLLLF